MLARINSLESLPFKSDCSFRDQLKPNERLWWQNDPVTKKNRSRNGWRRNSRGGMGYTVPQASQAIDLNCQADME